MAKPRRGSGSVFDAHAASGWSDRWRDVAKRVSLTAANVQHAIARSRIQQADQLQPALAPVGSRPRGTSRGLKPTGPRGTLIGVNDRFSLEGRTAVITGASRGIGRAIALGYARAGASLALVGRDSARLAPVVEEIVALGRTAVPIIADVSSPSDVTRLAAEADRALGPTDILVNNAGGSPIYRRAEATTDEDWEMVLGLNLDGTFRCCREFGRGMIARRSGRIVNVVSIGARVGLPRLAAYCAAKAGVEGLTRALAVEWAPHGVLVNALGPAFVETDLTRGLRENGRIRADLLAQTPLGRFAQPDEVVGAAIFLASEAASYLTGQTLYVDGGWTAR